MALQPSNTGRPLTCNGRPLPYSGCHFVCLSLISLSTNWRPLAACQTSGDTLAMIGVTATGRTATARCPLTWPRSLSLRPCLRPPRAPRVCRACAGSARTPRHPPAGHDALITSLMDDLNYGKCDELITVANNTIMTVITYYIIAY
jgi:hypothetical protein